MGNCSEKDKRRFSHLSTLHGMNDNNYFDPIFTRLVPLASFKSLGAQQFLKETLACDASSHFWDGLSS